MDNLTRHDIRNVFSGALQSALFDRMVVHLDVAAKLLPKDFLRVRTRNDRQKPLEYPRGTYYFSFVHSECIGPRIPVIFAGAIEKNRNKQNRLTPAIRFRNGNPILHIVPQQFKFPYRKGGWVNVALVEAT